MVEINKLINNDNQRANLVAKARQLRPQFLQDTEFLLENQDDWRERFINNWIGIYKGKIYGPAETQGEVIDSLRKAHLSIRRAVFKFFPQETHIRI